MCMACPAWLRHCEYMPVLFPYSIPTFPQCDWTSEPKKKKKSFHHHLPCVRMEIRHWRDQQTEEVKQREPPWNWPHTAHSIRERVRYIFTIFTIILFVVVVCLFVFLFCCCFLSFVDVVVWLFFLLFFFLFFFFSNFLNLLSPLFHL